MNLAWIGTSTSIIGSFLVALGVTLLGYVAFLAGSAAWLIVAWKRNDKALAALNGTFFCANIIGLIRNWL